VRRKHLFEFGDLPWLPDVLREGIQNFLYASHRHMRFYEDWAAKLAEVVRAVGSTRIVDLCSGAAGPIPMILRELETKHNLAVSATMTDLFPNSSAIAKFESCNDRLRYLAQPIDAAQVPDDLPGIRTVFTGFHHMRPHIAKRILEDAFRKKQAICIFEYTRNTLLGVLSSVTYPLVVLMLMPTVRPIRFAQLILTYLVPALPVIIAWDGFVSNLRTYSPRELEELTLGLNDDGYRWEVGVLRKTNYPVGLPYLIGVPVRMK
jgi:hypothetical protein